MIKIIDLVLQDNIRKSDVIADWLHRANKDWSTMIGRSGCAPELTMFKGKTIVLFRYRTFEVSTEFLDGLQSEEAETFGEALAYGGGSTEIVEHEEWLKITKCQYDQMLKEYEEAGMNLFADEEYKIKSCKAMKKPNLTDLTIQ